MYFITAITKDGKSKRTFGYVGIKLAALAIVLQNQGSMDECLYDYLVVEAISQGIHVSPTEEIWFRWDTQGKYFAGTTEERNSGWVSCDKPELFKSVRNFAIG